MHQSFLIIGNNCREETLKLFTSFKSIFSSSSPDITIIGPVKNAITIDQIRQVKRQINQRPVSLPYKYIIFEQAQTLNLQAQNALLKTLEEPPPCAIIILEANDKSKFLTTILSRVSTTWANKNLKIQNPEPIMNMNIESALDAVAQAEESKEWLDRQMQSVYQKLQSDLASESTNTSQTINYLESCKEAKKMIEANVNAKFVLANLALQIP